MAKIVFTEGPIIGHEIALPESGITLGRSERCNLTLQDARISGEHVSVRCRDGQWWVYDLQSSNGTYVNGQRTEGMQLHGGDTVSLGAITFSFDPASDDAIESSGAPSLKESKPASPSQIDKTTVTPPATGEQPSTADSATPPMDEDDVQMITGLNDAYTRMKEQISRAIVGQDSVIEQVLIAIFCRGHALLVGVPGVAKTLLVSTLSHVLDLSFKRVQFTPDLMPSDITGTDVLEEDRTTGKRALRFMQGPIFANMVLADEINRTPPKTQAALLEAMQEHRVSVGEETYHLPEPFFVLATQNPIEQEGTYPLPEAQLDRFMFNIIVDYPTPDEERDIIRQVTGTYSADLEVALTGEEVLRLQQAVRRVPVADHVIDYARDLARASRPKNEEAPDFVKQMVAWGAGPRAGIYLITAAKARAILQGRCHVTTEDVTSVALPVLRHRVITTFNAEAAGVTSDEIVGMLIDETKPSEQMDV